MKQLDNTKEDTSSKNSNSNTSIRREDFIRVLSELPDDFRTKDAFSIKALRCVSQRTIARLINQMIESGQITRVSIGHYKKTD